MIFLLFILSNFCYEIKFSDNFQIVDSVVIFKNSFYLENNLALPIISKYFLLPPCKKICGYKILDYKIRKIGKTGIKKINTFGDSILNLNKKITFNNFLEIFGQGYLGIYKIFGVHFYPFILLNDTLYKLDYLKIKFIFENENGKRSIPKQTDFVKNLWRKVILNLVENKDYLIFYTNLKRNIENANAVEYAILIPDSNYLYFANVLKKLEEKFGWRTEVFTLDWILSHYAGVDDQEKIRNFLKDYYLNHSLFLVLFVGDFMTFPYREVDGRISTPYGRYFPSLWYYQCLDGDWNYDGDSHYGEMEDSVDFYPELFAGLYPVKNPIELGYIVNKITNYRLNCSEEYLKKAMFLGATLFVEGDGGQLCEQVSTGFPEDFIKIKLYEDTVEMNTPEEFWSNLNEGIHFYFGESHGSTENIAINLTPFKMITSSEIDLNIDADFPFFMNHVSCLFGNFKEDAILEHFLNNPKGALGISGNVSLSFPYTIITYNTDLFNKIFSTDLPLGVIHFLASSYLASNVGIYAFTYFQLTLFADPSLVFWSDYIKDFTQISFPESLNYGLDTFFVYVYDENNFPAESAVVSIVSPVYGVLSKGFTDNGGKVCFTVFIKDSDKVYLSVSKRNYHLKTFEIPVINGKGIILKDIIVSCENLDTFKIYPVLQIKDTFENFFLKADLLDGNASFLIDSIYIPYVFPSDSFVSQDFLKLFSFDSVIKINIKIFEDEFLIFNDTFFLYLPNADIVLKYFYKTMRGDTIFLSPVFKNIGDFSFENLKITLRKISDFVQIIDSQVLVSEIFPDEEVVLDSGFSFLRIYDKDSTFLIFSLTSADFSKKIEFAVVDSVGRVDSVWFFPQRNGIKIVWENGGDGEDRYDIYRIEDGGVKKLNDLPILSSYYLDKNVDYFKDYGYFVLKYSKFGQMGKFSDTVWACRNPPLEGFFPVWIGGVSDVNLPIIGNFSNEYGFEIGVGNTVGDIYIFDSKGRILRGFPLHLNGKIYGGISAGDIDKDGFDELIVVPVDTLNVLYAINGDGSLVEGFPVYFGETGSIGKCGCFLPPVLYDLDNDDTLEIIVLNSSGELYIFKGNGEGYINDSGLVFNTGSNSWLQSSPAVGDVDYDGEVEIVVGSRRGKIFIIGAQGDLEDSLDIPGESQEVYSAISLADFDKDIDGLEIAFITKDGKLVVMDKDGDVLSGFPISLSISGYVGMFEVSFIDYDGDSDLEIAVGYDGGIKIFDKDGNLIEDINIGKNCSSVCGFGNNLFWGCDNGYVYSTDLKSFPVYLASLNKISPIIKDIDFDGRLELIYSNFSDSLYVFELNLSNSQDTIDWPMFCHDRWRTGNYHIYIEDSLNKIVKDTFEIKYPEKIKLFVKRISRNYLKIKVLNAKGEKISCEIYDLSGRKIYSYKFLIDSEDYFKKIKAKSSGIYFLKLKIGGKSFIYKSIVLKFAD